MDDSREKKHILQSVENKHSNLRPDRQDKHLPTTDVNAEMSPLFLLLAESARFKKANPIFCQKKK
jgi:hypothetical protein